MGGKKHRAAGAGLFSRLKRLYADMEAQYDRVARQIGLDCRGCPDNCCVSYFQHHTYIEWAYLWQGLQRSEPSFRERVLAQAKEVLGHYDAALQRGQKPEIMCPLNEDGRCVLYPYRLMICRFHGVPNQVTLPDGSRRQFPGCIHCRRKTEGLLRVPVLDRTPAYIQLATLERTFTKNLPQLPKVDLTLAEMLVQGPPPLS